jgi:hypothetical protein
VSALVNRFPVQGCAGRCFEAAEDADDEQHPTEGAMWKIRLPDLSTY